MRFIACAAALLISGCAARPAPSPPAVAAATGIAYGVIVGERAPSAGGMRMAVLTALGTPPAPEPAADGTEFIIREDDGRTLSVVQVNVLGLHAGERVAIRQGEHTILARPAQAALPGG